MQLARSGGAEPTSEGMGVPLKEKRRKVQTLHPPPQSQFDELFDSIQAHLEARIRGVEEEVDEAIHLEEEAQEDAIADRLWAARTRQVDDRAADSREPDAVSGNGQPADDKVAEGSKSAAVETKWTGNGEDGESFWDKQQWLESVTLSKEEEQALAVDGDRKAQPAGEESLVERQHQGATMTPMQEALVEKPLVPEAPDVPEMEAQAEGRSWQQGQPELKALETNGRPAMIAAGEWSNMEEKLHA